MKKTTLPLIGLFTLLFFIAIPFSGLAQSPKTYSASGTFTVPAGVTTVTAQAWGGGGKGGTRTNNGRGGGGGGGAYAASSVTVNALNPAYTVTVGTGATSTADGNDSWFSTTGTVLAKGGVSVANNITGGGAGGTAAASVGTTRFDGGTGVTGALTYGGGGGSSAGTASNGNTGLLGAGGIAPAGGGNGGNGRSTTQGDGNDGIIPGGGGGGGYRTSSGTRNGGDGANGQVILTWTCPTYSLTSTTTASSLCTGNTTTVSLTGGAGLPTGNYTVSYSLSGANTGSFTTPMTVTTAGTGSFDTGLLNNAGLTTVTITNLSSGIAPDHCNTNITANNTVSLTVNTMPTITSTTPGSRTGAGTVNLSATTSSGTISWFDNITGGVALGTGPNFTTPGIVTTTTYYVEATNGSCTSSPRVAVNATINLAEITVLGNGNIILDEDTSPITTDYTNLGTTGTGVALTRTYTINNSGTVDLTIGTINITGTNASEFVVTTAPAATVAPGASTTFSIRFIPTALGTRNANVSFVTNDPDENPFNFDIAGVGSTGLIPEINVRGNGATIIDGDSGPETADHTDFGSVTIPGSVVRTFTIQNTGTGPLTLTGTTRVVITGSPDFTVTTQPSSNTIAAGGSLTFQVTYNPATTGSAVAIISIDNDDADENVYDFAITGAAVVSGREIDIQGNDVSIVDGDTTPSTTDQTNFGITNPSTPIALTYNVYSFGTSSLTITPTVSITGTNASMFAATALPNSLGVGGVTSFVITFTPTASLGVKTATITITSNDPDEGTYNFNISAEVQNAPVLTVAPGGITSNLKFWLKADSNIGSTADNASITSWQEQTLGNTKNAVSKFSKEPKFQNNTTYNVNFNPVIHFNGSNTMSGGQGFNNSDMFIVIKPTDQVTYTSSPMDVYCGDDVATNKNSQDVTGFEIGNTSSRHANELIAYNQAANTAFGVAEISTTKFYSGVNIFNPRKHASYPTTKMDILNNGNTLTTTEKLTHSPQPYVPYKDIVNTRYWLGRSEFFDASYDGDILEIINYDSRNNDTDRRKIETYLAIKYGITLGVNGTSFDYLNSDGSVIYAAGTGFNYNIAGIGRDDKSQLNQKQSKTENTASDITIGLGNIFETNSNNSNAFDTDKKFLVWGHNNNTLVAQPAIVVNMSTGITPSLTSNVDFISIGRTWKVVETGGNTPMTKVSIPSVMLTATITPPGDFLMFVSDSPVFNPTAEYRIMSVNGSNLETYYDFDGTKYITFGYAPERTFERCIKFNGTSDYLDAGKVLDLTPAFTVSAWVNRTTANRTIFSKRNSTFTEGYDLSINAAGRAEMSWFVGASKKTITSNAVIPVGIWHHIGVSFDGTTAKMYIDGINAVSTNLAGTPSAATNQSFLVAAADAVTPTSYFNGSIDEVRVWNVALNDAQFRYVMNQEILRNGTATNGAIVPNTITLNEISSIPWANLMAYYPMSTYTYTNAKDKSNNNYTAALRNVVTVDRQTAPLPYISAANAPWESAGTWTNSTLQYIPNSNSIENGTKINWNIVRSTHNITSTTDKTVLGLFVNSGTISATNDTKIEVSHYLKLDGKIDLVGMSQLVQTQGSDLDVTSSGSIERDQQGQASKFNYNYWSSPVSPINNTANNTNYTVTGVMKDGINTTPRNITWNSTYDGVAGNAGTPVSLARYWLYTFDNLPDSYANWQSISESFSLRVGQGYTLKGAGAATNFTFVGKPNNGTITSNTVSANQLLLVGNPYPSALDGYQFINDNANINKGTGNGVSTDGTLYFWEHAPSNNSHVLSEYAGGYGVLNLTGGLPPVAPAGINGVGTSTKTPKQYIPVGQGFFVYGNGTGGAVNFNNGQRAFVKEDHATSTTLFRTKGTNKIPQVINSNTTTVAYKKIRLGYNNKDNYHRQVLLGFMDDKATSGFDNGYDGEIMDDFPNDMYFLNSGKQLVIQGESYFNTNMTYPIGVKTNTEGKVSFVIDEIENFDPQQPVFIHDNLTDTYHDIRTQNYEVTLPAGTNNSRFSLRFMDKTLGVTQNTVNDIAVSHIQNGNTVEIKNGLQDITVEKLTLFNLLGQEMASWKLDNLDQQIIQVPLKNVSAGVYIIKVKTSKGESSKKIIVN